MVEGIPLTTRKRVIGHEHVLNLIRGARERDRFVHAYLFVGPDGVGKRTVAHAIARDLLGDECSLEAHPDFFELSRGVDAKTGKLNSGIRIEQARELRGKMSRSSLMNGWNVCVIDDVELLTGDAANALLKTLEEPHAKTVFFLLSTSADLVMPTIRSRCQTLAFGRVPMLTIATALSEEGVPADDVALLARLADGCPGRAFALAGDSASLEELRSLRDSLIDLPELDIAARWKTVERILPPKMPFNEAGRRAGEILDLMSEVLHDVLIGGYGRGDEVIHADARERTAQMLGGDPMRAACALEEARRTRQRIAENVNPRTALQHFVATL